MTLVASAPAAGHVDGVGHAGHLGQPGPPGVGSRDGTATFTDLTGPGACSFLGEPPDNLHVGLSSPEYATAAGCGGYLDVTGPSGTVRVKITDHCPRCAPGLVDVTRTAFARIADVAAGRAPVTYRLVRNPPLAETISVRVKTGSSQWWAQIQALDHGNPIARFEVLQEGGWRSLARTPDNYWEASDPGLGVGPYTVRITDVFDQQVVIDEVVLAPGAVQPTLARLYPAPDAPDPSPGGGTPTTSQRPVLTPTFSLPPSRSAPALREPPTTNEPEDASARTDGEPTAPLWPLFLVLLPAAALTRALTRKPPTG